jgi:steroid 5-alpha reductase family enzyme
MNDILSFAAIMAFMFIIWVVSVRLTDASIVDIFWGAGFVYLAIIYFFLTDGELARKLLILALVGSWGTRLSIHIFRRNHGKGEDPRYQAWRVQYGEKYWWFSFFQVYVLQGVLLWIISLPVLAAMSGAAPLNIWDGLGLIVWGIGIFFEAVGDWQLAQFKADPANKGKVMKTGLWAYTRHPNYFGDAAVWTGHYLIALAAGGWWTIFSPIIMTTLLMRVSGVALLEKSMETRPGYKEYIESTSAFFPLPPKKK